MLGSGIGKLLDCRRRLLSRDGQADSAALRGRKSFVILRVKSCTVQKILQPIRKLLKAGSFGAKKFVSGKRQSVSLSFVN
jgi:hypothetical protein